MTITKEARAELRAAIGKARDLPWKWHQEDLTGQWSFGPGVLLADGTDGTPDGDEIDVENAHLLELMAGNFEALLNALDAAEAENERLRATWTAPNGKVWSPLSANASGLLHMAERKWRRKAEDAEATIARLTDALETIDCHATIDMKPEVRAAIDKWRAGRKGGQ